jgi:hypothetical protein
LRIPPHGTANLLEARRALKQLNFHTPPKHASSLMIEIGVLHSQCLDLRIGDQHKILAEVAACIESASLAKLP